MPTFYTDPNIAWRTVEGIQSGFDRLAQLRRLSQYDQEQKIQMQEQQLALEEYKRKLAVRGASEQAAMGAITTAPQGRQFPGIPSAFTGLPSEQAGEPPPMKTEFDRASYLQSLGKQFPLEAMQQGQEFQAQDVEQQKIQAQADKDVTEGALKTIELRNKVSKEQQEHIDWLNDNLGSMAYDVLSSDNPAGTYDSYKWQVANSNIPEFRQLAPKLPAQYGPEVERMLRQTVAQSQKVKDMIAAKQKEKPKYGEEVPYPPTVEQQRMAERTAGRQPRQPTEREEWMKDHPGATIEQYWEAKKGETTTTRSMIEQAPKVIGFVDRIDKFIAEDPQHLGPIKGRWAEFWAGKVGTPDPRYTKLRTDVGLLQTLLMRMHVGARGGEYIMAHFKDLFDQAKQSPENLQAAMEEVRWYAGMLQAEKAGGENTVRMRAPNGQEKDVPLGQVEFYKSKGATVVNAPR